MPDRVPHAMDANSLTARNSKTLETEIYAFLVSQYTQKGSSQNCYRLFENQQRKQKGSTACNHEDWNSKSQCTY